MMKFAVGFDAPIAIRYPKGEAYDGLKEFRAPVENGKSEMLYEEREIALIAFGSMVKTAVAVREELKKQGRQVTLVNARFAKPLDEEMLLSLLQDHQLIVTMEENVRHGGFGDMVDSFYQNKDVSAQIVNIAIPDEYVEHGNVNILKQEVGLDTQSVLNTIGEYL